MYIVCTIVQPVMDDGDSNNNIPGSGTVIDLNSAIKIESSRDRGDVLTESPQM